MESQETAQPVAVPVEEARGRSTVDFPYSDLDSAVEIAQAVRELGVTSCDQTQLAAKLNMAPDGGGFRMRLITSKSFGLITYGRSSGGVIELTDIGRLIADPQTERRGRVDSFMAIPLYRTLFERLKGQTMPPPPAIERLMESLGVAPKQKDKARQVFLRSAKQAGLFELSNDRLTLPPSLNIGANTREQNSSGNPDSHQADGGGGIARTGGGHGSGGRGSAHKLHPFVEGLINKLPEPDTEWDLVARAKWLTTAANIFDLMYQPGPDLGIKVTLEGSTLSVTMKGLS